MHSITKAPRPLPRSTGRKDTAKTSSSLPPASGEKAVFDLRPWATSHRYRHRLDESAAHERDRDAHGEDRLYVQIICQRGLIYPYSTNELLAWTNTRGVLAKMLALDPEVRIEQRGDREATVRFPGRLLDPMAELLRPRRRRTLDPARARAIGRKTRFAGAQGREVGPEHLQGVSERLSLP